MRKILIPSLFTALFLFNVGCKEDSPILDIIDAAKFSCEEQVSDYYFEGVINGDKVCYHVGYDDYEMVLWKSTGFTSGATVDPNDPNSTGNAKTWGTFMIAPSVIWDENAPWIGHYPTSAQYFQIETPKLKADTDKKTIVEETIKLGDLALMEETARQNSFNIKLIIVSSEDKGLHAPLQSFGGKQENSYLRVTEIETAENGSKIFYTVTFEFACDLYIAGDGGKKYGRLEEGKMRIGFEVEK